VGAISIRYIPLCLTLLLAVSRASSAGERYTVYMGGGGDSADSTTTIFDSGLSAFGTYLQTNPWNSEVRFDGGHSVTEGIVSSQFPSIPESNRGPFTLQSYSKTIDKYVALIKSGKIKDGDQLLLMIDSHGLTNPDGIWGKAHGIAVGNSKGTFLGEGEEVSLSRLEELSLLAKAKHVNLAIVDMSCHSGNSLTLANERTCVITATGPEQYGYSGFAARFVKNMKAGKSLEDVFLETRKNDTNPAYPMISTPAGLELNRKLYPKITPFLYFDSKELNAYDLSPRLLDQARSCSPPKDSAEELLAQIEQLKSTVVGGQVDMSELTPLLKRYQQEQDQMTTELRSLGAQELNNVETCTTSVKYGGNQHIDYHATATWSVLLLSSFSPEQFKYLNDQMNAATTGRDKAQVQAQIQCLDWNKKKLEEITSTHPEVQSYKEKSDALLKKMTDTYSLAEKIATAERGVYGNLYSDLAKGDKSSNACKNFAL